MQSEKRGTSMDAQCWALLHDGGIDAITGRLPGAISIEISIQYLRQQFPGAGNGFRVILFDCTEFVYQEYDASPVDDFDVIVALGPEIVSVEKGTNVVVNCVMGTLTLSYGSVSIQLDSGEAVSFDQLAAASKSYWDAWSARMP